MRYLGCQIDDAIGEGLKEFRKSLEEARGVIVDAVDSIKPEIEQLNGTKTKASLILGFSVNDTQIKWEAVEEGSDGNEIAIFYEYKGPIITENPSDPLNPIFNPRPPSSYVEDNIIHCVLGVDSSGAIDTSWSAATTLPVWLSNTDVTNVVSASLVGSGSGILSPTSVETLSGGKDAPLTDLESSSNEIARIFGKTNYKNLLKEVSIPVIEDTKSATEFLEDLDSTTSIVGSKLYTIDGTNLIAINKLYSLVGESISKLKIVLASIAKQEGYPYLVVTENVSTTSYEFICNEMQELVTVTETYRSIDKNIKTIANQWAHGDIGILNSYIFWSSEILPSGATTDKLHWLGIPEEYYDSIYQQETAEPSFYNAVVPPEVYLVEDPELLSKLQMSDEELEDLLSKNLDGIKLPTEVSVADKVSQLSTLLGKERENLKNGMKSRAKPALAAGTALKLGKTFNDSDLTKELATRGKACARSDTSKFEIPNADVPNIPFEDLPNSAKQIESAFAAISSAVNSALKVFDSGFGAMKSVLEPILNQLQNFSSLGENLLNNNMASCLLGATSQVTGAITGTGVGVPSPGGLAGGSTPSIGGLSLPLDLFVTAMEKLSFSLTSVVTNGFTTIMKAIQVPICMAQKMINLITGVSEGAECLTGKNPDDSCSATDVQNVINESEDMTQSLAGMPQLEGLPTTETAIEKLEEIQAFSGNVKETFATVQQEVNRGLQKVAEDINNSLESKYKFIDSFDAAIRDLISGITDLSLTGNFNLSTSGDCLKPSVGTLADAIFAII